jgi:hypothetical protein
VTDRVERFVGALKDDPRVVGIARLDGGVPGATQLLVVTTWDGFDALAPELPRIASPLLADGPRIERNVDGRWTGVDAEGARAEIALRRVGDLVPTCDGAEAEALHDPRGLVKQWIQVSRKSPDAEFEARLAAQPLDAVLTIDAHLRFNAAGNPGPLREMDWMLSSVRPALRSDHPSEAALARRIDAALRYEQLAGEGLRVLPDDDPAAAFESFLAAADDEGFKGDRVLFGEAVERLRALAKRSPTFDQGFVVPTFDAVEAAFALGDAVGGCQPPLVPGVYVGVGVTPTDALEFWAAPFVRFATSSVACVDDHGGRDVVARAAGRGPMTAALTSAVDAAWDRLPALIERARESTNESVDPSAVLAPLHLPKSFVERAKRHGADALMCSRLRCALALCAAGEDASPLVARKLSFAAGRALARSGA